MSKWETINLGDSATFVNGYPFKPTDWSNSGKGIIRIQNLTKGSSETNYFSGEINDKYKVRKGDILISWSATLGVYEWNGDDAWLNQHIFKVIFDKKVFEKNFFSYLISVSLIKLEEQVHGATMKHITKKKFDMFKIPFPPLLQQQKIANILDAADALRQTDKALIVKYEELTQALFLDMFGDPVSNPKGWPLVTAENHIDLLTGYAFKSELYSQDPRHTRLCGGLIIMPWGIEWDKSNRWDKLNSGNLDKYLLKTQDIVMAMDRPWIGSGFKIAQIKDKDTPSFLVQRTARIRSKDFNLKFLYYLYNSSAFERHARPTETTVPHISPKDIKSYLLFSAPIKLQNQFAERVALIEEQKTIAQASLIKSEELFNSLLQKAFKGELM